MAEQAPAPAPWQPRKDRAPGLVLAFLLVSGGLHVAGFAGAADYAKSLRDTEPKKRPVELVMFEVERPPPPPPPPPVEEPPPQVVPQPKPPPVKIVARTPTPPPPSDVPPPPNDAPPPETPSKPVPLVTGISMSSTSSQGGFAAPVGNTMYGKLADRAQEPAEVKAYRPPPGRFVPAYQVDRTPELLSEVKVAYPPEARRAGIEGSVVLSVRIDAEGNVTAVKVLSGPGHGLEDAAAQALRKFRWRPASRGGEAVATEIRYTYTFLLD